MAKKGNVEIHQGILSCGLLVIGFLMGIVLIYALKLPDLLSNDYVNSAQSAQATAQAVLDQASTAVAEYQANVFGSATSVPTAESTKAPQPTEMAVNQPEGMADNSTKADGNLALEGKLFQTPVKCTDSFNQGSSWLICEPGVILDNTAAWTIPGTKEPWYINVPEGGFTFFSMGEGAIAIDGVSLDLPGEEGLNYLVVIRGRIDDTIVDRDLNLTAKVTDFVPGHAIWSIMPPGAYVSKDWFRDQLVVSTTTGGTNCGATGCTRTRIVLFDVDSHTYQMFETHRGDIDNWTLLAAN